MNCEQLREQLAGDPQAHSAAFGRHAGQCQPCRAFYERFNRCEDLLARAVRFDPDALREAHQSIVAGSQQRSGRRAVNMVAAMAVAVIAGLCSLMAPSGPGASATELAAAVVEHWDHEPESWEITDIPVSANRLGEVLAGVASIELADGRTISFARICRVGNDIATHLVVQGEAGAYMVILLPDRVLQGPVPLDAAEFNLAGNLFPAGAGAIAVLGNDSAELSLIESELAEAVTWET